MTRKEILDAARAAVNGERDHEYGCPENNFQVIADLWNVYLEAVGKRASSLDLPPTRVDSSDVAVMMALLKIARLASSARHADSWIDLAGYAACGGEISTPCDKGKGVMGE